MPTPISQTLEEKKEETEKQTLEPDADQKAEEVLGKGEGTVEEVAEDVKTAEFNVTADSTTTEKETTETEPSDIVEEGEDWKNSILLLSENPSDILFCQIAMGQF